MGRGLLKPSFRVQTFPSMPCNLWLCLCNIVISMSLSYRNARYLRLSEHVVLPLYVYVDERHTHWMTEGRISFLSVGGGLTQQAYEKKPF